MKLDRYIQQIKKHISLFENFTYITVLQLFIMATPLITYPYLVRVLGRELYGWVITAQVLASYCSIFIDFGFKAVSARHISVYRNDPDKLSEIVSAILSLQFFIWGVCLFGYVLFVYMISSYREHLMLFLFSFGLTFNELLFPQYYFQGIEQMKYIAMLNIAIRIIFVVLTFVVIQSADDYLYVPLLSTAGYFIGGICALYIVFVKHKIHFSPLPFKTIFFYLKDASPIFFTNVICTIKDKLNYLLLGNFVGMNEVVVYDLGAKFTNVLTKPATVISTVLFPKIAKERNIFLFKKMMILISVLIIILVLLLNLFLPDIVHIFIVETIDLFPIRLYTLAPIFLSLGSFIASNLIVALGYNKYMLHSIIITTFIYLLLLGVFCWFEWLYSVTSFIVLTVLAYLCEFVYRWIISLKIIKIERG